MRRPDGLPDGIIKKTDCEKGPVNTSKFMIPSKMVEIGTLNHQESGLSSVSAFRGLLLTGIGSFSSPLITIPAHVSL
jgi:hypothetical protein